MKSFLRRFKIALLFASTYEQYVSRVEALDWTDSDTINAARFFNQGTGLKLLLRLETGIVNMALEAAQRGDIHGCGVANGASMQLSAIRAHSQFPPGLANEATNEESEQQARLEAFAHESA